MRVSTAVTVVLSALLTMSLLGAVAAAPAVADPSPVNEGTAPVADRSPSTPDIASPSTAEYGSVSAASLQSNSTAESNAPLEEADPKQVIRMTVRDNGDVRWTIESRFRVTSDEDAAMFRDYAAEVTTGQSDVTPPIGIFRTYRRTAEQRTGREMSLTDAGWDEPRIIDPSDAAGGNETAGEDVRIGVISYSFTWTNFATVEGDRIRIGDAFRTDTGTWMDLAMGQRLVIETPSHFALETPTRLTWNGPYEFETDELAIVFVQTGGGGNGFPLPSTVVLLGVVGALVAVGAGGYLVRRRDELSELPIPTERLSSLGLIGRLDDERTTSASDAADGRGPTAGAAGAAGRSGADGSDNAGTTLEFEEPVDDTIDPELLSDEERVLRLLKRNGGRMKQASIVTETGWSNAKVSQLLSKMDDDDEIEKLRIGRENLITLPGVDPTELD